MPLLLIYPIVYSLFFIFTKNKKQHLFALSFIGLYILAGVAACQIHGTMDYTRDVYLSAIIFHCIMSLLLLLPLVKIRETAIKDVARVDPFILRSLAFVIIVSSLIKIASDIPNVNFALMLKNVHELRTDLVAGTFIEKNIFIRYVNFFAGGYWSVALVLAFYYMKYHPQRKLVILLLLISSLSVIVSGFVVAAREYLLKYIMLLGILTIAFFPALNNSWKSRLRRFLILSLLAFGAFFVIITLLRFGEGSGSNSSAIDSVLSYLGQGQVNFSQVYHLFPDGLTGGRIKFPIFVGESLSAFNLNDVFYVDYQLNTFSTTIGCWIIEVGIFVTVLITILHYFIFRHVAKSKMTIFTLIYILWIYDFMFSSVFFYNENLNGSRVVAILFIVFLDFFSSRIRFATGR